MTEPMALEAGFDQHLTKPLGPDDLQEVLNHRPARAGRRRVSPA